MGAVSNLSCLLTRAGRATRLQAIDVLSRPSSTGTGPIIPWRDLPERFGPWQTVWKRHRRYSGDGTWDKILCQILAEADGQIDWTVCVDATINRTLDTARRFPLLLGDAAYTRGMSMNVAEVEQALLALDERDRAAVIHRGLRSFDAEDADTDQAKVDAAWRVELRRRIDDIESGKVELLDVDESHAQLRAELAARRA